MNGRHIGMAVALWAGALPAVAGRRDGAQAPAALMVTLDSPAQFGTALLLPRVYRVTVVAEGLVFTDPTTMVTLATVAAAQSETATVVVQPEVLVQQEGKQIVVLVRYGDREVRAVGVKATPPAAEGTLVEFDDKQAAALPGPAGSEATEAQLVAGAVRRYLGGVKHCGDRAHRHRWGADEPKFFSCVCPIAKRWLLPKVVAELEFHQPLAAGKNGFSLLVSPAGRVVRCRVWSGATPPPSAAPAAGPSSVGEGPGPARDAAPVPVAPVAPTPAKQPLNDGAGPK